MSDELLTTKEVATLLGVGTTSVKRWADAGLLGCVKTAGKHRRFRREDVARFMRSALPQPVGDGEIQRWLSVLLARPTDSLQVQSALLEKRSLLGRWSRVGDSVAAAMKEIGSLWRSGELGVLDEHLASEALGRALARVSESIPVAPSAPASLLATVGDEHHTLGISLLEPCLREAGWSTHCAGGTPLDEVVRAVESDAYDLVALSSSPCQSDPAFLADVSGIVARACRKSNATLLLGGGGEWPTVPHFGYRFNRLDEWWAWANGGGTSPP